MDSDLHAVLVLSWRFQISTSLSFSIDSTVCKSTERLLNYDSFLLQIAQCIDYVLIFLYKVFS